MVRGLDPDLLNRASITMAHKIETDFSTASVNDRVDSPHFHIHSDGDRIAIQGGLSTGKGRWHLTASAVRQRRRIVLQVLAQPAVEEASEPRVEVVDHAYRAVLHGLTPGVYWVRITHAVHAPGLGLISEGVPACEATIEIVEAGAPREATGSES
jgi:hypothetical protein